MLNNIEFIILGRRQAVRHLVLVQAFRGSNPFAPGFKKEAFLGLFFASITKFKKFE